MKINVLGTEYCVETSNTELDANLIDSDGYCDTSIKVCIIDEMKESGAGFKANIQAYKKQVIRHELVHAFFHESGLDVSCEFAKNETLVDWIAIQFPKMLKAFREADAL